MQEIKIFGLKAIASLSIYDRFLPNYPLLPSGRETRMMHSIGR
jgi:hypothetical protein